MLKFKKYFACLIAIFMLISSSAFAVDNSISNTNIEDNLILPISEEATTTSLSAQDINEDLYIFNSDSYTLKDKVNGNIFASTQKFTTDPKNNGGIISGNLFIVSNDITIGSDVSYSDEVDSSGTYSIKSIYSKSQIKGNVYAFGDSFTLQAGSEIKGDLYIFAQNVSLEQYSTVEGNVFIYSTNIKLNGQVSGSAYISSENFDMKNYGFISRDLYLNSTNATLSGIISRNAFITADNDLKTTSYFKVEKDLNVNYANTFNFAGEVKQNAVINAKNLSFDNSENTKCIIRGDLKYGTQSSITVPDEIVTGETRSVSFVDLKDKTFSVRNAFFSFLVLLAFVLVIIFLIKRFAPNVLEKVSKFDINNILISAGIGLASIIALIIVIIVTYFTVIGIPLSLFFIVAYLFAVSLGLPIIIYTFANKLNFKYNIFVKILLVTAVFYLITLIPIIGSIFTFVTIFTGVGKILFALFKKNK